MINITDFSTQLADKSVDAGLQMMGEVYLPAFLIIFISIFLIGIIIAIPLLNTARSWGNFLAILIVMFIFGLVLFIFTFYYPVIPKITSDVLKGWLT